MFEGSFEKIKTGVKDLFLKALLFLLVIILLLIFTKCAGGN